MKKLLLETVTLSTARGRIAFFCVTTAIIYIAPFSWLENLSLWKRLGFTWAPSIGLTRAYWQLIHFDVVAAWKQNWLIFITLGVWLVIMMRDIWHIKNTRQ